MQALTTPRSLPVRLLMVGACAILAGPAQAANFLNGDFADGLNGWTTSGAVSATGTVFGGSVLNGSHQAVLSTASRVYQDDPPAAAGTLNPGTSEVSDIGSLESFLGLPAYGLDRNTGFALEGSAMFQKVALAAGDTVSFKWQYYTADNLPGDYAFALINGQRFDLADSAGVSLNGGLTAPLFGNNASAVFSFVAPSAGLYTVAVGVVDQNDYQMSSILAVDKFAVQPVPEPSEYAMLMAGLIFVGVVARRRTASGARHT